MRKHSQSILMTGIPLERGNPTHFEHDDSTAFTRRGPDDKVAEVHTPGDSLRRIHEMMHARHSHSEMQRKAYAGIFDPVRQIVEDCRIHLLHWPWAPRGTPAQIKSDARIFCRMEVARTVKAAKACDKPAATVWPLFATRLRQAAVLTGLTGLTGLGDTNRKRLLACFPEGQRNLAALVFHLLEDGRTREAAMLVQRAFFEPPEPQERAAGEDGDKDEDEGEAAEGGLPRQPEMEVIELPHTECITEATVGTRIATSGARIYRPALRKLVLPSRMFVRRASVAPQGTILIDASGSMGDFKFIAETCRTAPFATVAYYAGDRCKGWLYVYARNGMRAASIKKPPARDNTVDGPAMDWLLAQEAPRIMITDRGFCDVADSAAQIVRLERLEAAGLITVQEYKKPT